MRSMETLGSVKKLHILIQTSDEERIAGPRSFVGDRMARARGVVVEGPRRVDPADAAEAGAPDATERGRAKAVVAEDFRCAEALVQALDGEAPVALESSARAERAKSGVGASAEPVLESRVGADAVERGHLRVHDHPSKYILRSPEAKKTGPTSDALRPTTDARRCRTSTGWRLVWRSDAGCQRRR